MSVDSETAAERLRSGPRLADSVSIYRAKGIESSISQLPFIRCRMILDTGITVDWESKKFATKIEILHAQILAIERRVERKSVGRTVYGVYWLPSTIRTDELYEEYFEPFDKGFESYSDLVESRCKLEGKIFNELRPRERFIIRSQYMSETGLGILQSHWLQAHVPFVDEVGTKIAALIKPEGWGQTPTSVIM